MELGARVRVVSGKYAGTTGEFIGEGRLGVSVKPDGSSTILPIPTNGKKPVIELLNEEPSDSSPEPRA